MRRIPYAEMARRKASPGGEAGATSVATDEVEAIDYRHKLVRRCYLRPHPSRAMARDTFPSRGRLFSVPSVPCVDFLLLRYRYLAHRGMPPPLQCLAGSLSPKSPPFRLDNLPLAGYYIGCAGFGPKQRDSIVILHKKGAFTHVLSHDCCRSGAGPSHLPGE